MKTLKPILVGLMFAAAMPAKAQFRHPGCLHSQADFDRIEAQIHNGSNPAINKAWSTFASNWMLDKEDCWLNAITGSKLDRGGGVNNFAHSERDFGMCYIKSIYWKLMKDSPNAAERARATKLADEVVALFNRYVQQIDGITGNSNYALLAGFQGWQVANAAEILQEYDGWERDDVARFKQWVYDVWFASNYDFLYRQNGQCDSHYMSNWGAACASSTQAIGIFLDDPYIYNYAMMYIKQGTNNASLAEGVCGSAPTGNSWKGYLPYFWDVDSVNEANGTNYQAPLGYLCQNQENTRDQGHSQAALGVQLQTCEQAWNQGDDLWDFNHRIMAGGIEYTAGWCSAGSNDSIFMKNYPNAPWSTDCGLSETYQAAISYASRENKTPVYQLGYNHFANRMGLNMPYAKKAHQQAAASWSGGVEWGAGANAWQNYSDVAGFGDLMHNEDSATVRPTLLRGTLTLLSGTAQATRLTQVTGTTIPALTAGSTYRFPELSNIADGSVVRLQPIIVDGSPDTGNWMWEDDATLTNRERDVLIDTSKVLRVRYTNAEGATSTQMFSLHREGDGFRPTVKWYYSYNGSTVYGDTSVYVKRYSNITLGLSYTAGTNNRSLTWQKLSTSGTWTNVGTSNELQLSNVISAATYRVTLITKAGIKIEKTFALSIADVDPYIVTNTDTVPGLTLAVEQGSNVKLTAAPNNLLGKSANYSRVFQWVNEGDTIQSHTLTYHLADDGVTKVADLSDTLTLTNLQEPYEATLVFRRISSAGVASAATILPFSVPVYTKNDLATDYYYIIDPATGRYLCNTDAIFTKYDDSNDDTFQWRFSQLAETYGMRYLIISKAAPIKHLDDAGTLVSNTNYNSQSVNILRLVNGNDLFAIQASENSGNLCWNIDGSNYQLNPSDTYCTEFPFRIISVESTAINSIEADNATVARTQYFTLDGREINRPARGIFIIRKTMTDGGVKVKKIIR